MSRDPAKLPIHHLRADRVVSHAEVDAKTIAWLSQWTWYVSDQRRPSVPKAQGLRPEGGGLSRRVVIYLSRMVWLGEVSEGNIWLMLDQLPPVRFRDGNPFNCQRENLFVRDEGARRRGGVLSPLALPERSDEIRRAANPTILTPPPVSATTKGSAVAESVLEILRRGGGSTPPAPGLSQKDLGAAVNPPAISTRKDEDDED